MRCLARPNWTVVVSMLFVGYVLNSMWTLASLFMPPTCSDDTPDCILSHLASKPHLQLLLFTSSKRMISDEQDLQLLDRWEDVQVAEPRQRVLQVALPSRTRQRAGSLYLHAFLCPAGAQWRRSWLSDSATYASSQLVKLQLPAADSFNLLGSEKSADGAADASRPPSDRPTAHKSTNKRVGSERFGEVPHHRSVVPLLFLSETVGLPRHALPPDIGAMLLHRLSNQGRYLPILHADGLTSRSADLVRIDEPPGTAFNVTVTLTPVSLGRLRLWMQFELGMRSMRQLGFTDKDLDEVKGIFADTNLYLLLVTMFVASMHLLFDFLAFKNDVQFWRGRGSFAGISSRTVVWRAFSQFVILLYLIDEQTSYLVIVPMAIGTVIEVWKVSRAFRVRVLLVGWRLRLQFGTRTGAEQRTAQLDSQSMRYLSYLLYPLCVGGAVYSLVYTPHKSWYSWCLQSVVNGVYAFGFLFMLPQLFVNYKLKSVAHLPWRALMYKAFNTFIDDLFAFIITMPTAHRVACFRDDLVFIGYVAQRWMYPVDLQRQQDSAEGFSEHVQLDEQPAEDSVIKKRQ